MAWLQDTQRSLMEKLSRAEDFYSHILLRRGFRNWLKVCLHHSGEMTLSKLAAASLFCTTVPLHMHVAQHFLLHYPCSRNMIPFFRVLLSALHSLSFFSTQDILLCTAPPLCTVSPCSPLTFLCSCPHYPSLPQSHQCSVSAYWAGSWEEETILTSFSVLVP